MDFSINVAERVRTTADEVLGSLSLLSEELSAADNNPSREEYPDVTGVARQILTESVALAVALVDFLPELELEYADLDVVLSSIAQHLPKLEASDEVAELFPELFSALREISYDAPRLDSFPDVEDCNASLDTFVTSLLRDHAN